MHVVNMSRPHWLVGRVELAEFYACSIDAVANWELKDGFPAPLEFSPNRYELRDVQSWRINQQSSMSSAKNYNEQLKRLETRLKQLKVEEAEGKLLPVEDVRTLLSELSTIMRSCCETVRQSNPELLPTLLEYMGEWENTFTKRLANYTTREITEIGSV